MGLFWRFTFFFTGALKLFYAACGAGVGQSWHRKCLGTVCKRAQTSHGLPEAVNFLAGSHCVLYAVDLHVLHKIQTPTVQHPDAQKAVKDDTRVLRDFLEELAEVQTEIIQHNLTHMWHSCITVAFMYN